MPTFNRPFLLKRALESLAAQTYTDFEVVVVNDAGVSVREIVDAMPPTLNVNLVEHDRNLGRCGALNTAVREAKGHYAAFLDDDDFYYPHHLRTLVDALAGRTDLAVYSHAVKVQEDEQGEVVSREIIGATDFKPAALLVTNYIVGMAVLVEMAHVRAVGAFDPALRVLEDWDLWIKLAQVVEFEHVPVPTAEYRWRPGKGNQTMREWFRFHEALQRVYANHPVPAGPLREHRTKMLEMSSERIDAYPYEMSFVVLCEGTNFEAALATAGEIGDRFGSSDVVELVFAVPDVASWGAVAGSMQGDVQAYGIGGLDGDAAIAFLRSRAGGRRLGFLEAGEAIDYPALDVLMGQPGGMAHVGHARAAAA